MPPCCAIAIARCDSVTVSIAADEIGILRGMLRVKRVVVSASVGRTPLRAGTRETSSKVRASLISPASIRYLDKMRVFEFALLCSCKTARPMLAKYLTSFGGYQTEYRNAS